MIGVRSGLRPGIRAGLAVGIDADPIAPPSGGIPGVTRDAGNMMYFPANASEWTALMSAAGLATGNSSSVWNCDELNGNLSDAIGAVTLTAFVAGIQYQQALTGASRLCIKGIDGTSNQRFQNTTNGPNPATTSVLQLMFLDFPAAPGGTRGVTYLGSDGTAAVRWLSSGVLRLVAGANADMTVNVADSRRWLALQQNVTATTTKLFLGAEKITGTYAATTAGANAGFGGAGGAAGPISAAGYGYVTIFSGSAAELSELQIKVLLQTLGETVLW